MNLSSGSRDRIIGKEKVRTKVVDATLDKKAAIQKFKHINASKTIFGRGDMLFNKKLDTRSVICNFVSAAEIVRDPRKTKIIGSVNLFAKSTARTEV